MTHLKYLTITRHIICEPSELAIFLFHREKKHKGFLIVVCDVTGFLAIDFNSQRTVFRLRFILFRRREAGRLTTIGLPLSCFVLKCKFTF